jgi:beta-glucosidase
MDVEVWIEHPNVTAVVWAGVPGQESGNALVDVLYGVVNPSGRLPYTIAKNINDYPAHIDYVNRSPPLEPQVEYTEKLNIDYRHFLANDIEPRFGFGYGLSYTTFEYSDINIGSSGKKHGKRGDAQRSFQAVDESMVDDVHNPSDGILAEGDTSITTEGDTTILGDGSDSSALPTFGEHEGGHTRIGTQNSPKLHRARWTVTATVSNTGKATGWAVPQLYISYPEGSGEPPRVFRDFERVRLRKGKSQKVKFELSAYDVSVWDVVKQKWVIPEGEFIARVADNAFDEGVTATWTPQV